jgi:hypothetical protein
MMLSQLVTATGVLLTTVAIHGMAVMLLFRIGRKPLTLAPKLAPLFRFGISCFFVIGFVVAHIVEIIVWAAVPDSASLSPASRAPSRWPA